MKKFRDVWDVHQAVRYFICGKDKIRLSFNEGPVVDHLRGTWMRSYDYETDEHLKTRMFIDWTTMPEGRWTGMYGAAAH